MTRIVVLRGGFAGLEAISVLERRLRRREDDAATVRLLLVEAGDEILPGVHPTLGERARRKLRRQGIEVLTGTPVTVVEVMGIRFSGYFAWLLWNAVHLWKLVGFRKPMQVAIDWTRARHFPRDSAIVRPPERCPVCREFLPSRERQAA